MQGGVRRGVDALKAVAMGARAVALDADSVLWGIIRDGNSQGLADMVNMLNDELKLAMVLTHCAKVDEITADHVVEWIQPKPHQWRYRL